MKVAFDDPREDAVTPSRLINAISLAIKYAALDEQQIRLWLESDDYHSVIDQVYELVESCVDEATWKRLRI